MEAKHSGKHQLRAFSTVMSAQLRERLELEVQLAHAVDREQLRLEYQPQVDRHGKPVGAEALLRWQRSDDGTLLPDRFIHLAERDGRIAELGLFVVRAVCRQIAAWQREGIGPLPLSVNVSPHQFRLADFAPSFAATIVETGIDARWLKLEITESAIIDDPLAAAARLGELARLGVGIAIDDFGVGYSSLSRLRHYPVDTLKIDRSFLRDIATDAIAGEVVGAIIRLAHKLGMQVVAEGIETEAQLEILVELGCDAGQGFLLARAMPAGELAALR